MAFGFFKSGKKEEQKPLSHYHDVKVKQVIQETKDAITLVFDKTVKEVPYKPGQFLTLILSISGKEVRRAYSLCSSPDTEDALAVTVKRVEKGLVSNWLADNLKAGDSIKVMAPTGHFTPDMNEGNKRHLILFAGGSGITPMMAILKSLLAREPQSIVSLIYCNRNEESIIFKEALDHLEVHHEGRLHVIHVLDHAPMNWQGYSGLLNHDLLEKLVERIPNWGADKTTYLMCGPEGMMKNVETLLSERGVAANNLMKESFVQGIIDKGAPKKEEGGQSHEVAIRYEGEEYKIKVAPGQYILETALDQGIDLPYSCQSGLCTACRGRTLSGKVKMTEEGGLSQTEKDQGYVLICVGKPLSDDVVIEIG